MAIGSPTMKSAPSLFSPIVWLGLHQFIEDTLKAPGGLVRWDRITHAVQRCHLEFVVHKIGVQGNSLRLETRGGCALRRFLADGRPIAQFSPPSTHY